MRCFVLIVALVAVATVSAQTVSDPGAGANARAQAAADVLREAAKADIAFLAAGLLKPGDTGDLSAIIQYPTDKLVVVTLTGKQVLDAAERSVSNYPDSNSAFLQLSGMTVTFSASAPSGNRVQEVRVGDFALEAGKKYTVAMPASLARGALGYFKVWDKNQISRELDVTAEQALRGKTGSVKASRYIVR